MRFSEYYKLNRNQAYLDFVDIPLDTDVEVFLDPVAIKALNTPWSIELSSLLQSFFETVLKLIRSGQHGKARFLLSSLKERNEFHLGYSAGESRGHAFGEVSAKNVWGALTNSQAAVTGLLRDLEDTALLLPGIGTDMISDAVCNILRGPLIKYTQDMCRYYGVPLTEGVPSGPLWNPQREVWEQTLVSLPMTSYGKVILVPKILVRQKLAFRAEEYYRFYILPQMQHEHLESGSALVEVLKNGTQRVTKKALIAKYGCDKLAVAEQTRIRPDALEEYRAQKSSTPPAPMTLEQLAGVEDGEVPDLRALVDQLEAVPPGAEAAHQYEDVIERLFTALFYPTLGNPSKQHRIHQGRKRVDITYMNHAQKGFFAWLSLHYPCPLIFVECKNYGKELGNPEIDQLAGRFSPSRGQVGILVCRSIEDRELLQQRCVDTAKDGRGYILALDDSDVRKLVEYYLGAHDWDGSRQNFPLLKSLWSGLIS